ncbi:4-alpha-glucanotransferase [Noviherbaspirillum sp. CPCC 100848]|uniref:4-alpha-glucanotransferase n=1 Tax=Noviherbaspirillum album TaxID=3080276 RepID=A0ABU6J1P0_9BURK|nr:4-alpha-glucanotransferase [Noviherbaspirillum sp. CPCC 100848]MEC4717530.1 4-alpha-glucanotransferase [Noviherbaspirillum sp. CPCC 100848]
MNDADIIALAKAAGLVQDWVAANGEPKTVAPEDMRAILEALDLPCGTAEQCAASREKLRQLEDGSNHLPPLVTGVVGQPVKLGHVAALAGGSYRIELEDGAQQSGHFGGDASGGLELPAIDRPGYHRLLAGDQETTLAIAPPRCFGVADALAAVPGLRRDPRLWGLGVQLYSLRRDGDGGIGDFGALAMLARKAARHGAAALAISPVHAMFSADVHRFSPYGPSSRLFLNALHIDPAAVMGAEAHAAALASLGPDTAQRLAQLEQEGLVDWPGAAALKLSLLRRLYERYLQAGNTGEFDAFLREGGDALRDHARFEAIHAARVANGENGDWRSWPDGLRDPRGADVEAFAQQHAQEVGFHAFLQWQAAKGLSSAQKAAREAGMPIGLITDLAVGADSAGSQAWSRQTEIINGLSVGAPPDVMNSKGQSWGIGAFSPVAMKAKGFAAYLEMLRATFAYAGGARIDHVLGLGRLWLVPHGASPEQGAYLTYPMQDLLRLIALESWRHKAIVIGEDLGTVPEGFDRLLADAGLLGIRVLLFQRNQDRFFRPDEWPSSAIATTTTHDLPTIAGWWQGRDIDWRRDLGLLPVGETEGDARHGRERERRELWEVFNEIGCAGGSVPDAAARTAPMEAAIDFIGQTPAPLAMLPIEDALGLPEQPNLPGTIDEHPNWRRRMPHTVDAILDEPDVAARLAILNRSRSPRGVH